MTPLVPLITQMVVDGVVNRKQPPVPVRTSDVVLAALAFFGAAAAGVCTLLSFYFFMRGLDLTPSLAALATAGVGLAVMFLSCAAMFALRHMRRRAVIRQKEPRASAVESVLAVMGGELEELVADNPATATALAGLAGFVAAEKMH